ncbi:hypothetical protein BUALT_BualtUnG0020500 [Buddleja alternifolia]|uniref:Uncharacterized protein n=1 Tax=Buddleja alternifolia TaxID=168488 RepID=A0AAV6W0J8_9LAMI|nr:hypothetical protein BUALT_BualtUnG0020500 [Buddleja alternifolia]
MSQMDDATKEGSRNSTVSKTQATGDWVSQVIVLLASVIAALLTASGGVNGVVVAFVFGDDLVSVYYAFLVCVMFAFSSSFSAILILQSKPKAARLFKIIAILCFSSALILLKIFSDSNVNLKFTVTKDFAELDFFFIDLCANGFSFFVIAFSTSDGLPLAAAMVEDDGALSLAAGLAKEAVLLFQAGRFVDCLRILYQFLQKKEDSPKVRRNIAVVENLQDGCSDPKRLIEVLENIKTIEPIDEGTALRVCPLLLEIALLSHNASRSAVTFTSNEPVLPEFALKT